MPCPSPTPRPCTPRSPPRRGRPRRGRDDRRGRPGRLAAAEGYDITASTIDVFDGDRLVAYGDFSDTDVAYTGRAAVVPGPRSRYGDRAMAAGDRAGRGVDADRHPGSEGSAADRLMRDLGYEGAVDRVGPRAPAGPGDQRAAAERRVRDPRRRRIRSGFGLVAHRGLLPGVGRARPDEFGRLRCAGLGSSRLRALEPAPVDLPRQPSSAPPTSSSPATPATSPGSRSGPIIGAEVWPRRCWSTPSPWRVNTAPPLPYLSTDTRAGARAGSHRVGMEVASTWVNRAISL